MLQAESKGAGTSLTGLWGGASIRGRRSRDSECRRGTVAADGSKWQLRRAGKVQKAGDEASGLRLTQ